MPRVAKEEESIFVVFHLFTFSDKHPRDQILKFSQQVIRTITDNQKIKLVEGWAIQIIGNSFLDLICKKTKNLKTAKERCLAFSVTSEESGYLNLTQKMRTFFFSILG